MGKWVIFIGDRGFDLDTIRAMSFAGKTEVRDYGQKQLDVLFREGYVSFRFDEDGFEMIIRRKPCSACPMRSRGLS